MLVLVVDGHCASCSALGHRVSDLCRISVVPRDSAEGVRLLAGVEATAPCLLELEGGSVAQAWHGWAMRARLARLAGLRGIRHWPALLYEEARATDLRERGALTRRTVLLGALGGVAAAIYGGAAPASAAAAYRVTPVEGAKNRAVAVGSSAARDAVRSWGEAREVHRVEAGGARYVALRHAGSATTMSFIDEAAGQAAITVRAVGDQLSFYLTSGEHVTTLRQGSDGKTSVVTRAHQKQTTAMPTSFLRCLNDCIIGSVGSRCANRCYGCAGQGTLVSVACTECIICAGLQGVTCARLCRRPSPS